MPNSIVYAARQDVSVDVRWTALYHASKNGSMTAVRLNMVGPTAGTQRLVMLPLIVGIPFASYVPRALGETGVAQEPAAPRATGVPADWYEQPCPTTATMLPFPTTCCAVAR